MKRFTVFVTHITYWASCTAVRVIAMIMGSWNNFRDYVPLIRSKNRPEGDKARFYSAYMLCIMLYGTETWPVERGRRDQTISCGNE